MGFLLGGLVLGLPLVFFRFSRIATAFGTVAASAVVLSVVVGQIWASLFLRRVLPSPTGTLFAGRGTIGVRERWLSRRAQPESVRLTGSPGLVRLWGNLYLALDGLELIPNAFALGSAPIVITWNEVRFAEVVRAFGRTALKLSLSDASTVWIETAASRADEIRSALFAAGVKPNPEAAS